MNESPSPYPFPGGVGYYAALILLQPAGKLTGVLTIGFEAGEKENG